MSILSSCAFCPDNVVPRAAVLLVHMRVFGLNTTASLSRVHGATVPYAVKELWWVTRAPVATFSNTVWLVTAYGLVVFSCLAD
ncbi:hypothetical protein E2P81_ATG00096 [Venturia nashicola]|uniref:Uncharacterized protein n=1 Tax=Venturia nashicola TaxID=86259 RepID=A0A4Z1PFH5_9PEZI|nr:hypothetical protein E6O75_ATG00103 [Venturia nashicola]TLD39109.1 hypothetical protein E2P81_ATG00096 [Venturia nashicola]